MKAEDLPIKLACYKRSYPSEASATLALMKIHSRPGPEPKPTAAYLCKNCGTWHLTKREK